MNEETPLIILLERMDELLQAGNPIKCELTDKKMAKFYEITQNQRAQQFLEKEIVSPEYLMTMITEPATKVIVNMIAGMKDFPKIAGAVHSSSEVNYFKPLTYGSYDIVSQAVSLQKKQGKMGEYLVFVFKMSLINQQGEEVANDIHQFFMRLRKEGN